MFTESASIKIFSIDFIVIEASSIQNLIHFYLGIYSLIILGYFSLISEFQIIFRVFSHPWDPVAALCLCLFHEGRILFKKCECDRILLINWERNLIATSPISYTVSFSGFFFSIHHNTENRWRIFRFRGQVLWPTLIWWRVFCIEYSSVQIFFPVPHRGRFRGVWAWLKGHCVTVTSFVLQVQWLLAEVMHCPCQNGPEQKTTSLKKGHFSQLNIWVYNAKISSVSLLPETMFGYYC